MSASRLAPGVVLAIAVLGCASAGTRSAAPSASATGSAGGGSTGASAGPGVPGASAMTDAKVVVADVGRLLDKMLVAYRTGNASEAADIAAEAYTEHYELIEGSVRANAPAINAELEPLLAAMLRQKMREGAPVAEVEQLVMRARNLLADALVVLEAAH